LIHRTRSKQAVVLLFAAIAAAACRNRGEQTAGPQPPTRLVPSFRSDVLPVLQQNCASAEGCHGDKPTDSVRLDLRPQAAYAQLVNAAAQARKGVLRVAAGVPASSFLLDKLTGTLGPREGKTMPVDPDTGAPFDRSPLPPDFVQTILTPWIAGGAPNN